MFCGLGRAHLGGAIILPTVSVKNQMQLGELRRQLCVDTNLVLRSSQSRKEADDCPHRTYTWEGVGETSFESFSSLFRSRSRRVQFEMLQGESGVIY